ncbi:MAG: YqeG family HAD IIIA-type phosphatase [Candidatus Melainabacteria bacterium]|jgi:HAD superfamily phosphatase (TIGR01668 family)|nr:YqeG family HAD IIIA-type phosphatase [Candidatus Melainabacteria bacterium]
MFLKPDYLIDGDITDIDLDRLAADGIKGLILDLDSTIMAPKSGIITDDVADWLARAQARFAMAVASNNKNTAYLEKVQQVLTMPIIFRAAKPSRKAFLKLVLDFDLKPSEIAVIGDRPLTDIWGGKRAGMKTILVRVLKTMQEPVWKSRMRNMERIFIKNR